MFATIETKSATHIIIHIPHDGAEKSLPALARLLEQNAVFTRVGYHEMAIVKPEMSIVLGDQYVVEGHDEALAIKNSDCVIGEDFVNATPDVLVSNMKARKRAEEEQQRLRTELSYTKDELARLKTRLEELTNDESV